MFVRDVAGVVATGTVVGLALALPAGRFIGAEFTGGGASPVMIGGVALALLVTALLATIVPAARAARIDPAETLSQE